MTLTGSSALTFTTANWNTTQNVTISAAEDDDTTNGSATFGHSASSGDSRYNGASVTIANLVANEVDNNISRRTGLGAPTNLRAEPGDRQVKLSWNAVDGATEYEYQQTTGVSFGEDWISTGGTATSTVVTGLNNGTRYTFRVRAVQMMSPRIAGTASEPVSATPAAPPLNLIAIPHDQYVTLSWDRIDDVNEDNWLYTFLSGPSHGLWLSSTDGPTLGDDGRWTIDLWGWNIGHGEPPRPSLTNGQTYSVRVIPCLAECHDLNNRREPRRKAV